MPQLDFRYVTRSPDVVRSTTTMLAEIARSLVDKPERVSVKTVAGPDGSSRPFDRRAVHVSLLNGAGDGPA